MSEQTTQDRFEAAIDKIRVLLVEVVGEDLLLDVEIDADSTFAEDIELESIDLVALTELLEIEYGTAVDFAGWIADMDLDAIISLSVGDLARFVVESTAGAAST